MKDIHNDIDMKPERSEVKDLGRPITVSIDVDGFTAVNIAYKDKRLTVTLSPEN